MDDDAAPPPQDPPMDADDDAKPPAAEAETGGDAPPAPEGENGGDAEMSGDAPTSNTEGATTAATGEGGGEGGGNLYLRPIFLGNLSHGCLASDIEGVFQNPTPASGEGGEVRAPIPVDRVDMKRGYCFVFLKDPETQSEKDRAEAYVSEISGMNINQVSNALRAEFARGDGRVKRKEDERRKKIQPNETLFVVNFHEETTKREDLQMLFEPYGELVRIDMRRNYAFVQFKTVEEAVRAKEATNGGKLDQSEITVEYVARRMGDPGGRRDRGGGRYDDRGEYGMLSLDEQLKLKEEEEKAGSFSNYQEAFQQMKQEYPNQSLGALQQMTMARMAELKEIREREGREKLQEERLKNRTIVGKIVGKMVNPLQQIPQGDLSPSHAEAQPAAAAASYHAGRDAMQTHFVPTGARPTLLRLGGDGSSRRISVESAPSMGETSQLSRENKQLYINAGEDQKGNFAPRRSVGDLSQTFSIHELGLDEDVSDDKSICSRLSNVSGLFMDESVFSENRLSGAKGAEEKDALAPGDVAAGEPVVDILQKAALSKSTPDTSPSTLDDNLSKMSEFSDSQFSASCSRASSGGLIVGFPSTEEEDEESGLIVGFGDRTKQREKRKNREDERKEDTKTEGKAVAPFVDAKDDSNRSDPVVW
ncbi:hypothetical protein ACHAXT_011411 [Thalassiosira profunda]